MKNIIYLFAIVACLNFISCEGPQGPQGPSFVSRVFEIKNVNFDLEPNVGLTIYRKLTPNIQSGDVILVYRMEKTIDSSTPIWQLIPRTLFLGLDPSGNRQEIDYDYNFSKEDFKIYVGGSFSLNSPLGLKYINNQTFRIVIAPGAISRNVDVSDYGTVVNLLENIGKDNIRRIDMNK